MRERVDAVPLCFLGVWVAIFSRRHSLRFHFELIIFLVSTLSGSAAMTTGIQFS